MPSPRAHLTKVKRPVPAVRHLGGPRRKGRFDRLPSVDAQVR